mgnify:CR=1 FL=1
MTPQEKKLLFEKVETQLIVDEDLRLKPYRCPAGKLTIGVGRNLEDNGITREEAYYLLRNDVDICHKQLSLKVPFYDRLPSDKKEILLNMCFNMGLTRLQGFRRMLAAMALNDWESAATEMADSNWAKQVGDRAKRLINKMKM